MTAWSIDVLLVQTAHDNKIVSRESRGYDDGQPPGWEVFDIDGRVADTDAANKIVWLIRDGMLETVDDDGETARVVPTPAGLKLIGVTA